MSLFHAVGPMGRRLLGPCVLVGVSVASSGCALRAQGQDYERLTFELARDGAAARAAAADTPAELMGPEGTLDRERLTRAVLARNPTLSAARAAWRAAIAEYRGARALEDPMLEYQIAPLSIGSRDVEFGQSVQVSQRFSWPGKRALAAQVVLAEAEVVREGYEAARLRLSLMAALLFDEYYAVERALEISHAHRRLLETIAASAQARYEVGHATQEEVLRVELELGEIERQRVTLTTERRVSVARLNGLLHRPPAEALPPPPTTATPDLTPPAALDRLLAEALDARPELAAATARMRSRDAAIALARRDFYPEVGAMASYSTMWMAADHRLMVGLSLNVPVQTGARRGAVDKAQAERAGSEAELAAVADAIGVDVSTARARTMEALELVRLHRERLVPTAEARVEAARIAYETGRSDLEVLIDAERSLRALELQHQRALADLGSRRAELDHALGRIVRADEEVGR
jgi:cobalt-zinc-cadmium efflux system outer membrane protein